ncbi:MAG: hypothetical protein KF886_02985 [Candidatus Hydrogenedentes bacterium]|nr:hypothetical protein [Candidatus Hydrogenedentota bacterium]
MPKLGAKVTVTKVSVKEDSSVGKYKKDTAGLKEITGDLGKAKLWGADVEIDDKKKCIKRVRGLTFPDVGGHPGHVHSKGAWKYNIERGNSTVDRLVVEDWSANVKNETLDAKKGYINADIEISCKIRVLEDTH